MAIGAAHGALRAATAAAHERLDALYARFDLARAASYAAFLQAHAAAMRPVEAWLDAGRAATVVDDWPARRRAALLAADCAAMGVTCPAGRPFATGEGVAAVAGVLYVVEGSRLGGRYLARAVPPAFPHGFLDPAERPSWPGLLAAIDRVLADPADHPAAIAAALATFARFEETGAAATEARAA